MILTVLQVVLILATAGVLAYEFRQSRLHGFLVVGLGIVLWPAVSLVLFMREGATLDRSFSGGGADSFLFPGIVTGSNTVGDAVVHAFHFQALVQTSLVLAGLLVLAARHRLAQPKERLAQPSTPAKGDTGDQLLELAGLLDRGHLSREEFDRLKGDLLGG